MNNIYWIAKDVWVSFYKKYPTIDDVMQQRIKYIDEHFSFLGDDQKKKDSVWYRHWEERILAMYPELKTDSRITIITKKDLTFNFN